MDAKKIYRRFVDEVVVGGDITLIDELFVAEPVLPAHDGLAGFKAHMQAQKDGLDMSVRYEHQFQDGDWVITHMTVTGTMTGDFLGHAPTGRTAVAEEIEVARIVDDRIEEMWSAIDMTRVLLDLGIALPS